jgi:radical SAM superfamily enzyme YgiQ (UPF0313 family)
MALERVPTTGHALLTPVPARLAHSSVGFHAAWAGLGRPERAVLAVPGQAPRTLESGRTPGDFDVLWVSTAWELEVPVLATALRASGVEPRRSRRPPSQPLVILGGPLTLSNPDLGAALADAVFVGEADGSFGALRAAVDGARDRDDALARLAAVPGTWVPVLQGPGACPTPVVADPALLPARTVLADEPNEFGDAFLVEVGRGCPRACTFCVVRGGVRKASFVPADRLLAAVPDGTPRVGLLGAAVSDHPQLLEVVQALQGRRAQVTLGSVRADRVTSELLEALAASGLRTLTVAADGPSEALRASLRKGITADHLRRAADLARSHGLNRLRIYAMVGLPGETDADVDELGALVADLSTRVRVALSVSPFVPKRFTPLAGAPFAGVRDLKRRLTRLSRSLGGTAALKSTSPREAEREFLLSHVRMEEAEALL